MLDLILPMQSKSVCFWWGFRLITHLFPKDLKLPPSAGLHGWNKQLFSTHFHAQNVIYSISHSAHTYLLRCLLYVFLLYLTLQILLFAFRILIPLTLGVEWRNGSYRQQQQAGAQQFFKAAQKGFKLGREQGWNLYIPLLPLEIKE